MLQTAILSREALLPEYERALAEQADLDPLLNSIHDHVLLTSHALYVVRSLIPWKPCWNGFAASATRFHGAEMLRCATRPWSQRKLRRPICFASPREVSAAKATIKELTEPRAAAEQRLLAFCTHLATALIEFSDADKLRQSLIARQKDLQERPESIEKRAEALNRELKKLQASQAEETAERLAVHERITALDRGTQELSDQTSGLDARMSQILPGRSCRRADLGTEMPEADLSIDEIVASIAQLQSS